jgi:hypothetical protein
MSSRIIDNVIAYKLLRMLVTPFVDTEAFKLGIIDAHGNTLIKSSHFTTDEQRNAFTFLNRLVFNVKKMINKFGGENRLKSMAVALWLIRESYQSGSKTTSQLEPKFKKLMETNIHLVEEEILVGRFLKEDGVAAIGGAPANNTSGPVSTQEPKIYPNSKKKPIFGLARRSSLAVKEIK